MDCDRIPSGTVLAVGRISKIRVVNVKLDIVVGRHVGVDVPLILIPRSSMVDPSDNAFLCAGFFDL